MSKTNKKTLTNLTHEGGQAVVITDEQALRRSVLSCLLWEDEAYESGDKIALRIASLIPRVEGKKVAELALEARKKMHLRHVPLFIIREMARYDTHKKFVAETLASVIERADEISEFMAIYWKDGKVPISAQVKKGLAEAFKKFDPYQFAKYDRKGRNIIQLRDVMFMVHPKPCSQQQADLWHKLASHSLPKPDTWERLFSDSPENKAEIWNRLIREKKLGSMALLRNLRNREEDGADLELVKRYISETDFENILPFRFLTADAYSRSFSPELEKAMLSSLRKSPRVKGKSVLLIDVSGSMLSLLSSGSWMSRLDAAGALAVLLREVCEDTLIFTSSDALVRVEGKRGFELFKELSSSQSSGGTFLGRDLAAINQSVKYDRIIMVTDEQTSDDLPLPSGKGYLLNVASAEKGIAYKGWVHIDGWSEAVINYIVEMENEESRTFD